LDTPLQELVHVLVDWETPSGRHTRTHAAVPVWVLDRLSAFVEEISAVVDGRPLSADSADTIISALCGLAGAEAHTAVVAAPDERPLRSFQPLVMALRNAATGQRPTRWPAPTNATPDGQA
jgi:hypothetical protein